MNETFCFYIIAASKFLEHVSKIYVEGIIVKIYNVLKVFVHASLIFKFPTIRIIVFVELIIFSYII